MVASRDYEQSTAITHGTNGGGNIFLLKDRSQRYATNRIYYETNTVYQPHHHDADEPGIPGNHTWITDDAFPSPIESLSFFRNHGGNYFNVRANEEVQRQGARTSFLAEHLVVGSTHLYRDNTCEDRSNVPKDAIDGLRAFQDTLRNTVL